MDSKGLTVVFEKDVSEEYTEKIINAIKLLKGVQSVFPVETNADDNRSRV